MRDFQRGEKMFKAIRVLLLICAGCLFLSACATDLQQLKGQFDAPEMKINIPDRFFVDKSKMPVDIKIVSAAMINALRRRGETPFVRFDPAALRDLEKETFNYEAFDVILTDITGFEAAKAGQDGVQGVLEGVFHFEDNTGRRASTYFAAKYRKTRDGIAINKAGASRIAPYFPRVEAYFVPSDAFTKKQKLSGYEDLYAFALENALDMTPSREEMEAYKAYQSLSVWKKLTETGKTEKKKIAVIVFCLDRLSDVSRFEVKVTEAGANSTVKPSFINFDGWPVAIVAGEFVPDSWGATFDVSAYYYPEGKKGSLLVGKFSNQKDYNPPLQKARRTITVQRDVLRDKTSTAERPTEPVKEQRKVQETKTVQENTPALPAKVEGPLASGSVFLNPSLKSDARIIQKRLADLGYYKSTVDGSFGKGSQQAVLRYKTEKGLPRNTTWDIQTQKALFEGSGL